MISENKPSIKVVLIGAILPVFSIVAIDYTLNGGIPNFGMAEINPRIANSALTSFILVSIFLLGNMFFYGESRNRPMAPIYGMIIAVVVGVLAAIFFINQGPMLLEGNGSVRAQLVYNTAHTIVSIIALAFSALVTLGILFSAMTHSSPRIDNTHMNSEEE
tara:strand:- start:2082 stop:2564 length:483 start_codon:yes stop_codon:yes gene_type:complete